MAWIITNRLTGENDRRGEEMWFSTKPATKFKSLVAASAHVMHRIYWPNREVNHARLRWYILADFIEVETGKIIPVSARINQYYIERFPERVEDLNEEERKALGLAVY